MGNHMDFQKGVEDYALHGDKGRKADQSNAYNTGFDIARAEQENHIREIDSQRGVKL